MFFDKIFDVQNFTEITGLNDELKSIYVYNYYNNNSENIVYMKLISFINHFQIM